jgi:hypothetical protein
MKKTILVLAVAVMVFGTMSVAFADASWGPLAILEKLSGESQEDIYAMREEGETLGDVAKDLGVYDDFRAEALTQKKAMLQEMLEAGEITEAEAERVLTAFESCDGTQQQVLQGEGLFGQRAGNGQGNGLKAMDGEGFGAKEGGFGQGGGQMRRGGRN